MKPQPAIMDYLIAIAMAILVIGLVDTAMDEIEAKRNAEKP